MGLSSLQLEAFMVVARERHFSNAANTIGITQSALSLRIKNLEEEIGTTLFIRNRAGVQLTATAQELLRYCRMKESLETEFLDSLQKARGEQVGGVIRIGGFSSVMRSAVLPALAPVLKKSSHVKLQMVTRELNDLPDLLKRGEIDYLLLDRQLDEDYLEAVPLGHEENVLVSPKSRKCPADCFLDHDENDQTTYRFFQIQGNRKPGAVRRLFMDDVYGILDGVKLGLGRAVLPKHLVLNDPSLQIERDYRPLRIPVVLHYFRQPYYSKLHSAVIDALKNGLTILMWMALISNVAFRTTLF